MLRQLKENCCFTLRYIEKGMERLVTLNCFCEEKSNVKKNKTKKNFPHHISPYPG